jgi:hypothetical protein
MNTIEYFSYLNIFGRNWWNDPCWVNFAVQSHEEETRSQLKFARLASKPLDSHGSVDPRLYKHKSFKHYLRFAYSLEHRSKLSEPFDRKLLLNEAVSNTRLCTVTRGTVCSFVTSTRELCYLSQ